MFYQRLQQACIIKGTTPTSIAKEFNMSSGNVTSWKKGGFPSIDILLKLSERLDVSLDYLLEGEATKNQDLKHNLKNLLEIKEKAKTKPNS